MHKVDRLFTLFQPTHYSIRLDMTSTHHRTFNGEITVKGVSSIQGEVRLHAKDLVVTQASVGGVEATVRYDKNDELVISSTSIQPGKVEIKLTFRGKITDVMHGLYPCYYTQDGVEHELFATQLESHHAREVFPCVDEPEAKARFDVQIDANKGLGVLSNMPEISCINNNDVATHTFDTTPKMSSYLLAFVIGDLQSKSVTSRNGTEIKVYTTNAQDISLVDYSLALSKQVLDFFEEYYGTPYPLSKLDHVALPDFSASAMENWGLITYRESALLANDLSSKEHRDFAATTVAHETSHQWFGNLVTMRWWDDLWLNESFATMTKNIALDAVQPGTNRWTNFETTYPTSAIRRDCFAHVQPIRTVIDNPSQIHAAFDPAIVYGKGCRLLKMLMHFVGQDNFRAALQHYFAEHAYENTSGDDLWNAIASTSRPEAASLMQHWLSVSGMPVVHVKKTQVGYDLSQERFLIGEDQNDTVWQIPLFARDENFPEILLSKSVQITTQNKLPHLNLGNVGHFITHYDDESYAEILEALRNNSFNDIERLGFVNEHILLTRAGIEPISRMLNLLAMLSDDTSYAVWSVIYVAIGDLRRLAETNTMALQQLNAFVSAICKRRLADVGSIETAGEPVENSATRGLLFEMLVDSNDTESIETLCAIAESKDIEQIQSELKSAVITALVKKGDANKIKNLKDALRTTSNSELQTMIISGLTATSDRSLQQEILPWLTDRTIVKPQDLRQWFIGFLKNPSSRMLIWEWMTGNWEWIEQTFNDDNRYDDFARHSAVYLSGQDQLEKYRAFFEQIVTRQPRIEQLVSIGVVDISTRNKWIEESIDEFITVTEAYTHEK